MRGERLPDMLIRISIERTHPLAGTAATEGGEPVPFEGWLELLRVVSELVAAASSQDLQVMDKPHARRRTRQLTGRGVPMGTGRCCYTPDPRARIDWEL